MLSPPGIHLLDMIYIDSAYPASDSIIETEQRTNQMNNLLRVISDLQMSCNYGKKQTSDLVFPKKKLFFFFKLHTGEGIDNISMCLYSTLDTGTVVSH